MKKFFFVLMIVISVEQFMAIRGYAAGFDGYTSSYTVNGEDEELIVTVTGGKGKIIITHNNYITYFAMNAAGAIIEAGNRPGPETIIMASAGLYTVAVNGALYKVLVK